MKHFHTLSCNFAFGTIGDQIKEASDLAIITQRKIIFKFNDIEVEVKPSSNIEDVYEKYMNNLKAGN